MSSLCFTCSVILRPSPTPGHGQCSQRQGCTDLSQAKQSSNAAGKPIRLSEVSRAILIRFLLENENFIQILDNTPVLVTSGTRLEFGLSRSVIMDMGTQPGEKTHTQSFTVFQVLLVVNKGKIKITDFKVMIHPSLSLKPNIFRISCCSTKITQSVITR